MPVVAIESALQMLVLLGLQEIVVVTALREEASVDVVAVVADLVCGRAERVFVHGDQLRVFGLFVFVEGDLKLGFLEFVFESVKTRCCMYVS